ncbi:MAG: PilN domain-containing protein [Hyphomicrobium sp.]
MNEASQPVFGALSRVWNWWIGELASLLPWRRPFGKGQAKPGLVVSADPSGLRLIDERTRRPNGKSPIVGDLNVWDALSNLARSNSPPPVRLRLPSEVCFIRRVEVPQAARGEVGRFLDLDLERATPFRLKDVYSDFILDESSAARGVVGVTQVITRRENVDKLVRDIESAGLEIAGVECWNSNDTAGLPIDFLAKRTDDRGEGRAVPLTRLLAAASVALAASAAYIATTRYETALGELTSQVANAKVAAEAARQQVATSEEKVRERLAIHEIKSGRPSAVAIVDALTRILPDAAWLSDLRIDGDTVQMSGEADAAAPLIAGVENDPLFSDVSFAAPVTRDQAGGKERFSLRAQLSAKVPRGTPEDEAAAP